MLVVKVLNVKIIFSNHFLADEFASAILILRISDNVEDDTQPFKTREHNAPESCTSFVPYLNKYY